MSSAPNRKRVVDAVNYLILAPNYAALANEITNIIERWDARPVAYQGKLECLNVLVDVGVQSREAFEQIIRLIEERRKLIPEAKRVDYQRELMRDRRARMAKAVELQEIKSGPLAGAGRKVVEEKIATRWREAKEAFVKTRGELSWKERNEVTGEFWAGIDRQLNANLAAEGAKRRGIKT